MANLKKSLLHFLDHLKSSALSPQIPQARDTLSKQTIPDTLQNKKEICLFILSLASKDKLLFNKNEKLIEELMGDMGILPPSLMEDVKSKNRPRK